MICRPNVLVGASQHWALTAWRADTNGRVSGCHARHGSPISLNSPRRACYLIEFVGESGVVACSDEVRCVIKHVDWGAFHHRYVSDLGEDAVFGLAKNPLHVTDGGIEVIVPTGDRPPCPFVLPDVAD